VDEQDYHAPRRRLLLIEPRRIDRRETVSECVVVRIALESVKSDDLRTESTLTGAIADVGVTVIQPRETPAAAKQRMGHMLVMERFGYPDFLLASAAELIDGPYRDRPNLRPVFDAVIAAAVALGEVTIQARKTYVSLVSPRRTFARVQPTTKDRLDLGLRLQGQKPGGRLLPSRIHETMQVQITPPRPRKWILRYSSCYSAHTTRTAEKGGRTPKTSCVGSPARRERRVSFRGRFGRSCGL
jgi:hypothetical protein